MSFVFEDFYKTRSSSQYLPNATAIDLRRLIRLTAHWMRLDTVWRDIEHDESNTSDISTSTAFNVAICR